MRAVNKLHERHACLRRRFTKKVGTGWPSRSWEGDDTRHDCAVARITLWRPPRHGPRIMNEVRGMSRVVYDISSKLAATIERE
jgi:hypothetical protein